MPAGQDSGPRPAFTSALVLFWTNVLKLTSLDTGNRCRHRCPSQWPQGTSTVGPAPASVTPSLGRAGLSEQRCPLSPAWVVWSHLLCHSITTGGFSAHRPWSRELADPQGWDQPEDRTAGTPPTRTRPGWTGLRPSGPGSQPCTMRGSEKKQVSRGLGETTSYPLGITCVCMLSEFTRV